ncbi:hypothetical protein DAI22_03g251800 [Oryza sativa Japonica Group]|nr:hypothetical protein DAI22_03g251800 [Oryza sativa Japonica Group]
MRSPPNQMGRVGLVQFKKSEFGKFKKLVQFTSSIILEILTYSTAKLFSRLN